MSKVSDTTLINFLQNHIGVDESALHISRGPQGEFTVALTGMNGLVFRTGKTLRDALKQMVEADFNG